MPTAVSEAGIAFIAAHEGFVSRAYRDSGGVLTIGYGFTASSSAFSAAWQRLRGHQLTATDTISRQEADGLLPAVVNGEYLPPVLKRFGDKLTQPQIDACTSVCYNAGAGSLQDRWAEALAAGRVAEAATLLRTTRTSVVDPHTHQRKTLAGLLARRAAEARLLETGDYGQQPAAAEPTPAAITRFQSQLAVLGYYVGPTTGSNDSATRLAVLAFQRTQPSLVVDGTVGPATRAALEAAVAAKQKPLVPAVPSGPRPVPMPAVATGAGAAVVLGLHALASGNFWLLALVAATGAVAGVVWWRNRHPPAV